MRAQYGSSFGTAASEYAKRRPDYALAAVRWAIEPAGPAPRVLDLGAGTGKLTQALVGLGAAVTAVEPDPAMLDELRRALPGVPAWQGSAEDIPLPAGSVDVVIAGQALHWFNRRLAGPEIARVLAEGGILAGLWNLDDDRTEWVAGLAAVADGRGVLPLSWWQASGGAAWAAEPGIPDPFGVPECADFPHGARHTADSLVATMATHSPLLVLPEAERSDALAQLRAYLGSRPETASGEFVLPMVTSALRCSRAGAPTG